MRALKVTLCVFALAVLVVVPSAQASLHPFLKTVATGVPIGEGKTQPFNNPCGLAVGPAGELQTSDYPLTEPATAADNAPCGLAIDSTGRLFANHFHGYVEVFGSGAGILDSGRGTGVAVDPSTDTLYVTHRTHVSAYEAPATPGDIPIQIGLGSLTDAYGAAVSGFGATHGYLYVAEAANDTVKVFDPATDLTNPIQTIDGSETPLGEFRDLTDAALAVDSSNGHVFVLDNLQPGFEHPVARVYEFDADGVYLGQIGQWVETVTPPPPAKPEFFQRNLIHGGPSGIAVDNSVGPGVGGNLYVSSGNEVQVVQTKEGPIEAGNPVYAFCGIGSLAEDCPAVPPPAHVLEVTQPGSGEGTVTSFLSGMSGGATLPGIECGTICASEYDQGTTLTLTATPKPHSAFTGWSIVGQPGVCPGSTGVCKVTINADTEVIANFKAIPQRTLTVTKSGTGLGTVTSSPAGIECGLVCSGGFDEGSTPTLTAEAFAGSEFTGWSGACSGTGACKVTMGADRQVAANFQAIPRFTPVDKNLGPRILAISVTGEGAGTISANPGGIECGTPCSGAYPPGTKVTLSAKPDDESAFSGWSGCDSKTATTCVVVLGSSRTVGASFAEATPLELAGLELKGAKALLSVAVPGKGTLSAKAKEIKPVSAKARKAETLSLPLTLNKAAQKALKKKGKLKVKVTLSFKPTGAGTPRTLEKTIVFRKKGSR